MSTVVGQRALSTLARLSQVSIVRTPSTLLTLVVDNPIMEEAMSLEKLRGKKMGTVVVKVYRQAVRAGDATIPQQYGESSKIFRETPELAKKAVAENSLTHGAKYAVFGASYRCKC